jgi:putative ABC transport system permease protein
MIYVGRPDGGPTPLLEGVALEAAREAVAHIADTTAAASVELQLARNPNGPTVSIDGVTSVPATSLVEPDVHDGKTDGFRLITPLYVADPAVLRYMSINPATLRPGIDVITPRRDLAMTEISTIKLDRASNARQQAEVRPTFEHLDLPVYDSEPTTLIARATVERLGLTTFPAAWALRTPRPITTEQLAQARRLAGAAGLTIETHDAGPAYTRIRLYATSIGMIVALAVLAMSVGLIRAESLRDVRTLAATGASASTRRAIAAVTASALGLVGALLAIAGAYTALVAWQHSNLTPLRTIPLADLTAITIGLPTLAALGGWLLAGREPSPMPRTPMD